MLWAAGRLDRLFHYCFQTLASIEAIFEAPPPRRPGRSRDLDSVVLVLTHQEGAISRLVEDCHPVEEASAIAETSMPMERHSLQRVSFPVDESTLLLTGPGAAATG